MNELEYCDLDITEEQRSRIIERLKSCPKDTTWLKGAKRRQRWNFILTPWFRIRVKYYILKDKLKKG